MSDAPRVAVSTFRRRVLGVGLVLAAVLAALGAPWYLQRVDDDLSLRVPERLAAAGYDGVRADFSGQDGTLTCSSPLAEPAVARDVAATVHGVRSIRMDRSCRVSSAPTVATTVPAASGEDQDGDGSDQPVDVVTEPAFESLVDLVGSDPRFSIFATLVTESGQTSELLPGRTRTVLVPTDDAFDAWPPDALAELRSDPGLLRRVVRHHVLGGAHPSASFGAVPATTIDGVPVALLERETLVGEPPRPSVARTADGAELVDADLTAVDGIAHAIDVIRLPPEVDLVALRPTPVVRAVADGGRIVLSGRVGDEVARVALVAAAARVVDPSNVVDELTTDDSTNDDASTDDAMTAGSTTVGPSTGDASGPVPSAAAIATFARVLEAVVLDTGAATVELVGERVEVTGTWVDDAARERLEQLGSAGVVVDLGPRPMATSADLDEVTAVVRGLFDDDPVRFEAGTVELPDGEAARLDLLAGAIRRLDGIVVAVEGATDSGGPADINLDLSERRAQAVAEALVVRGVPAAQLEVVGRGEDPILVDGVEDVAASRRVEFVVRSGTADVASNDGAVQDGAAAGTAGDAGDR